MKQYVDLDIVLPKKCKKRYYNALLTISILGLIVCFVVGIYLMNYHALRFQQNAIGALYLEDKGVSKGHLYALYEDISEENIEASKEAMKEFAFTEKGKVYLNDSMGLFRKIAPVMGMCVCLAGVAIYVCYQREWLLKKEKEDLEAKIHELEQRTMQEDYEKEQNQRIQNFIENIAHQIKTPISRVYSSLYMLEEEVEDSHGKERIDECYSHLESVNALMKRLMDIGKLEAGKVIFKKEKLNLEILLEDAAKSCVSDRNQIQISFESKEREYYGDYELLREAFMNIIKNALEHDKSGEKIEIACSCNVDQMKISVRDHGSGLSEKDIPNLFDRFYLPENVKSTHTGIGLNLAKLIFEGHFGSIYVYNHAEGGAVFNVILPMYPLKIRSELL